MKTFILIIWVSGGGVATKISEYPVLYLAINGMQLVGVIDISVLRGINNDSQNNVD